MKRVAVFFSGLACLVILLSTAPAAAKVPEGVQVKPLRSYPALDRGSTGAGSLTLTNTSKTDQSVTMSTEIFSVTNENYDYKLVNKEEANWIRFDEPHLTLKPGESRVVKYSIAVPGDASAGGHYFALITTIDPPTNKTGVTEIKRVASLLYLEVSGDIVKSSRLVDFSMPWFSLNNLPPAEIHVANNGTSHTQARVAVYGRSWPLNTQKQQYTLITGTVLPGTVRKLSDIVQLPNVPGIYSITAEYNTTQGKVMYMNQTIFFLPIWVICLLILAVIAIVTLIVRHFIPQLKRLWRKITKPKKD